MRLALWGAVAFILLLGVIGAIDSFSTAYYAKVTTETTTTTVTESYTETQSTTYTETYSTTYTESSTETVTERSTETVTAAPQPYPNIVLILLLSIIMMVSGLYVVVSRSR